MEKLEKTKQAEIKKLSDKRLISKLTPAGCLPEEIEGMDRPAMLEKWAEIVHAGKEVTVKPVVSSSGYDIEFEKMRFDFQVKQWEADRAERQAQREAEALERKEQRDAESKRLEVEMKRLADEDKRWQDQLKLQEQQFSLMEEKQRSDRAKEMSKVTLLKTYGDALRNSITRMTNEPIELLLFLIKLRGNFRI